MSEKAVIEKKIKNDEFPEMRELTQKIRLEVIRKLKYQLITE